jgi:hypothetical protein
LAVPLVVVYQRVGVRAVVAVFSALLLACCYLLAVALVAVAQIVALAWWPCVLSVACVAEHWIWFCRR